MILLGDEIIPYENIEKIKNIQEINDTKPNSTLLFTYDMDLIKHCQNNSLEFAVIVKDIMELIYTSQFDAKYLICDKNFALSAQKIAENYMFDSKILAIVENSDEIVWIAQNEIDGLIYNNLT